MATNNNAPDKKNKGKSPFRKIITWVWRLFFLGVFSAVMLFMSASWGWLGEMPDHTILENPKTNLADSAPLDGPTQSKNKFA